MIHKCAVSGCPNKSDKVIHYPLPEEPVRRQEWIDFLLKKRVINISSSTRICGCHFSEDSFTKLDMGSSMRLILNINAVPSIYQDGCAAQEVHEEVSPASTSQVRNGVSSTIPLASVKEEPMQDELSCDAMRIIKVEVDGESAFHDSSSNQYNDKEVMGSDGTILKVEPCEEPDDIDIGKFHCAHCGEGFQDKGLLSQHEQKHKTLFDFASKSYVCKDCGKGFAHRGFLKAHQKIHANMESKMSFSCSECDRKFHNASSLKKHMQNHLKRLRYTCPVCGEDFEMKGSLHIHIKLHQGQRFRCKYCQRGFLRGEAYMKHVDQHTVVTPYYCEKCEVYLVTQNGFEKHQSKHSMKDFKQYMSQVRRLASKGIGAKSGDKLKPSQPVATVVDVPDLKLVSMSQIQPNDTPV